MSEKPLAIVDTCRQNVGMTTTQNPVETDDSTTPDNDEWYRMGNPYAISAAEEIDPRLVDWYSPGSRDFEVDYATESEDEWL